MLTRVASMVTVLFLVAACSASEPTLPTSSRTTPELSSPPTSAPLASSDHIGESETATVTSRFPSTVAAEESPAPIPTPSPHSGHPPPPVDTTTRSVSLEDIVFDTFDGGFVRLTDATPALIGRLRDAIRPIYKPRYEGPEGGTWLEPDDLVIGYAIETAVYAYPVKILNYHELVNDVIDGVPLLVSY